MKDNVSIQSKLIYAYVRETQDYKKMHEPIVTQEKKDLIQEKLMLEKQAMKQTKQRQKNNQLYLKYNYNPFIVYKQRQADHLIRVKQENKDFKIKQIIEAMVENQEAVEKGKQTQQGQNISLSLSHHQNNTLNFSKKTLNNIVRGRSMQRLNMINENQDDKIKKEKTKKEKLQERLCHYESMEIDDIVRQKEDDFFLKKAKINIFSFANNLAEELSPLEKLQKYFFSFDSIGERISKIKLPIFRDLSTLARKTMKDQKFGQSGIIQFVSSQQLSFKINQLEYHDLISIASNRISSSFLNKMLNNEETFNKDGQKSEVSSEEEAKADFFRDDQRSHKSKFINKGNAEQEIKDYKKLAFSEVQDKYLKRCLRKKKKVENQLYLQSSLYQNIIRDQKIHYQIKDNVQKNISEFSKMGTHQKDTDRFVRANKQNKNKEETIRIKTLIQTLAGKNKHIQNLNNVSK